MKVTLGIWRRRISPIHAIYARTRRKTQYHPGAVGRQCPSRRNRRSHIVHVRRPNPANFHSSTPKLLKLGPQHNANRERANDCEKLQS